MNDCPKQLSGIAGLVCLESITNPVVYFLCKGDTVVYVGQSIRITSRLKSHPCTGKYDKVFYVPCELDELDSLEAYWIAKLKPKLNNKQLPKSAKDAKYRAKFLAIEEAKRQLQRVMGIGRNGPKPDQINALAKELFDDIYKLECDTSGTEA